MGCSDPAPAVADALKTAAAAMGIGLSATAAARVQAFLATLLTWRRRVNLVSQRTATEIIEKHIQDSLALIPLLSPGLGLVDLGSGAGFPGLVIALVRPDVRAVLVESKQRKVSFLRAAIRETGAANVVAVCARAEDLIGKEGFARTFDMSVSRAVWPIEQFLRLSLPLLRPGGIAVAMRGPQVPPGRGEPTPPGYGEIQVCSYRLMRGEKRSLLIARRCST